MRKRRVNAATRVWLSLAAAAALEVAVVSLTPPTASEHYGAAGRAWRWKVAVMGEDMALPRPKTALALAESIVERSGGAVQEAATLSTCARLLLIVAGNENAVEATREACAAQIASFQTRPFDDWRRALDAAGDDIVRTCVEINILRRVRAESSRRPPRHRCDACSMAWRCRFVTARRSRHGRVIAEK